MKIMFCTFLLLMTISTEMVHIAYILSFAQNSIEQIHDIKNECENEENKDLGEEVSKIPSYLLAFCKDLDYQPLLANTSVSILKNPYCSVSTPPPDII